MRLILKLWWTKRSNISNHLWCPCWYMVISQTYKSIYDVNMERYDFFLEVKTYIARLQWGLLWNLMTILTCISTSKSHSESWRCIDRDSNFGTLLAFTKILKTTDLMPFVFILGDFQNIYKEVMLSKTLYSILNI